MKLHSLLFAWLLASYMATGAFAQEMQDWEGNQVLHQAIFNLEDIKPEVTAGLRYQVNVYGRQFLGHGIYQQDSSGQLFLEMKLQLQPNSPPSVFRQIKNERTWWETMDVPGGGGWSRKVDRERLYKALQGRESLSAQPLQPFALGGLPQLLQSLQTHFDFETRPGDAEADYLVLVGAWKPAELAKLLPDQADRIRAGKPADFSQFEPYFPQEIVLHLRKDLFPRRIEFRRQNAATIWSQIGLAAGEAPARTVMRVEFFNVEWKVKDPQLFVIPAQSDQLFHARDETRAFIRRFRQAAKKTGTGQR